MNLFVKPDEQSQTCLNFAMAKKGLMKLNNSFYFTNSFSKLPSLYFTMFTPLVGALSFLPFMS